MTESRSDAADAATGPRCPWCSAELKEDPVSCPSCGAALREETGAEIPGVTQLDPASTETARPAPRSRGLIGWLSGQYEAEAPNERASVEPPTEEVRAEMARLEMEAIQAEIDAAAAEEAAQAADRGEPLPTASASPSDSESPTKPDVPAA